MILIVISVIIITLTFAPLGCISLWKRYTYFADGLAHASLLAGSISTCFHISIIYSGTVVAIFFALLIFIFKNKSTSDASIILISSFMIALSLLITSSYGSNININNLLFGDIISVSLNEVILLSIILIFVIFFIKLFYEEIILIVINPDIAKSNGIKVKTIEILFLLILSTSIFTTTKIIGSLLLTSVFLIPAMSSRILSKTPINMLINSILISLISNFIALLSSYFFDIPLTPTITVINIILYFIIFLLFSFKQVIF